MRHSSHQLIRKSVRRELLQSSGPIMAKVHVLAVVTILEDD